MKISYDSAHLLVKQAPDNVYWRGWNIVIFDSKCDGFTKKGGCFRNGIWGFERVIAPNDNGEWEVPQKYAKYFTTAKDRSRKLQLA